MWRLHRYYLKEVAVNASLTFFVLFGVVLVSLVYRGIQRSQGGGALDAALITLYFALDALPHLLTIAMLIGTVLTFTRAAQDRELTAVRAAGISPRVPMTAAVLIGMFLSVAASVANHYVIPEVHYRKYRVVADVLRSAFINLNLGTDRIKVLDTGFMLTFRRREHGEYLDCTLYCPRPIAKDVRSEIVFVERITLPPLEEGSRSLSVQLHGLRDPIGTGVSRRVSFDVSLDEVGSQGQRDDRDDDVRSDQLLAEVLRDVHPAPATAVYTLFRRCCFALMPAALAPIGFCIAEFARDRGRVLALVLSLVPLAVFYLGEVLGARLLLSTGEPSCGWLPLVLLAAVGLPFCWRQLRK